MEKRLLALTCATLVFFPVRSDAGLMYSISDADLTNYSLVDGQSFSTRVNDDDVAGASFDEFVGAVAMKSFTTGPSDPISAGSASAGPGRLPSVKARDAGFGSPGTVAYAGLNENDVTTPSNRIFTRRSYAVLPRSAFLGDRVSVNDFSAVNFSPSDDLGIFFGHDIYETRLDDSLRVLTLPEELALGGVVVSVFGAFAIRGRGWRPKLPFRRRSKGRRRKSRRSTGSATNAAPLLSSLEAIDEALETGEKRSAESMKRRRRHRRSHRWGLQRRHR